MSQFTQVGHKWSAAAAIAAVTLGGGLLWNQPDTSAQQPVNVAPTAGTKVSGPPIDSPANEKAKSHANELSSAFRSAAAKILPAVVTIETETKPKVLRNGTGGNQFRRRPGMQQGENPFEGTPFEQFFGQEDLERMQRGLEQQQQTPRSSGAGSGVIIDKSGIILTNNHVVRGADIVTVRLADGREFKATDIKTDPQTDMAVVRIEKAGDLPAATLGNSDALEIGDWVIAVGNPFGLEQTVSAGIISGKGRQIGAAQRANFLQTDAAINPGNSGGPLVNLEGEVIGINTAIASNGGGNDGIGFAVPSNLASWVTPQLIAGGKVERAYLGVGIETINGELANRFGTKRGEGVLVTEVHPNTPAAEAGIQEGDVILDFNGVKVHEPRELQEVVERAKLDTKNQATLLRDGKQVNVQVLAKALPTNFGRRGNAAGRRRTRARQGRLGNAR
ncbi:MAG: trypsin-like peptidase domain-containing protein [Pirellulales bacterium]